MFDELDDFLTEPANDRDEERRSVEAVRPQLLDWAAGAMRARWPSGAAFRGAKGLAQFRLDLDRGLKRAVDAEAEGDAADWRRWILATVYAPRGQKESELDAMLAVLSEALVRLAPWPHGPAVANRVADLLGAHHPEVRKRVAQRVQAG